MPTLAAEDAEKLRAFEQRIQLEGAAAFADGPAPWENWEDVGTLGTYQVWRDTTRHPPPERPPRKPLTTRLLTGLAQLAVLALLVGTAGVYLSIITPDQRLAGNGVQPPPIVLAGRPSLRPATAALPVNRSPAEAGTAVEAAATEAAGPDTAPALAMTTANQPPAAADVAATPPVATVVPLHLEQAPDATRDLALALEDLPDTAAGPMIESVPAPAEPDPSAQAGAHDAPAADMPQQLALLTPAIDTLPEKPSAPPAPAQAARNLADTWVVNLASYNYESMARRKLATFRDKGVNAELVKITVRGKPMIRIRATGYQSRHEASDWIPLLEERLELKGAWVAKYEPGIDQTVPAQVRARD
jgi:hypothetical protein